MSEKNDGGPAFPVKGGMFFYVPEESRAQIGESINALAKEYEGMSLRDYFAAKALPSAIDHERTMRAATLYPEAFRYADVAHAAYVMADAMLAEREK